LKIKEQQWYVNIPGEKRTKRVVFKMKKWNKKALEEAKTEVSTERPEEKK